MNADMIWISRVGSATMTKPSRRTTVLVFICAGLLALVQFGARPAYDHWQSLANEARGTECAVRTPEDPRRKLRPDGQIKTVVGGEKVGHGSGGVVLLRGARKGSQWLA
jgi:hypothetical protein